MKKILLIIFLFCSVNVFAQGENFPIVPLLWKVNSVTGVLEPTISTWKVPLTNLNLTRIKKATSSTANLIPKWIGTTGDSLIDGYTVGTAANNLVQLDASAKLPILDGSQLTNLLSFNPITTVEIMEDFVGGTTAEPYNLFRWRKTSGELIVGNLSIANKFGIINLRTSASIGSGLYMSDATGSAGLISGNTGNMTYISSIRNSVAANAEATLRAGLMSNFSTGDPTDGIFFRASGIGNWYAVTRAATVETTTDAGIAQSATTFRTFKFVTNSAGTSVEFYIDGVLKATHTTNIPTADIEPEYQANTTTATYYGVAVDYFYLKITGLTR